MSGSLRSISSSLPPTDWGVPQVSVPWLGVRSSAGRTAPTGHTFSSGEHPPAFPRGRGFSQGYFRTRRLSSESSRASAEPVSNMSRSSRLSSSSLPPLEDDADSVCSDELLGSQSRLWLTDILSRGPPEDLEVNSVGRDGLFVDRNFPVGELEMQAGVQWKRPKEICSSPQFIVDGATRLDICQGELADCWFLSPIASLSMNEHLLNRVVPQGQSFQNGYNGCFTFRFWQYGQWEQVKVDDLLPTKNNKLIYLSSHDRNEFWSSLLEKAYAKLKGGYRTLDMGLPHEAMVDMTGGVVETLAISSLPRDLAAFLEYMLLKGGLINCANSQGPLEQKNAFGIVFRHAYSLTAVEKVETINGPVDLVRILNPWGNTEWEGPWSDTKGPEWNTVSAEEQKRLKRVNREDGEFWMSVSDFRQNFDHMEVCHLTDCLSKPGSSLVPWSCMMQNGNWVPSISAGGSLPGALFWQNPQFYFTLSKVDITRPDSQKCSFVLALMQKHQRRRGVNLSIGLHVYPAHPKNTYLSPGDLNGLRPLLFSQYSCRREVVLRDSLPPGRYIIIPSTSEPNQEGSFLLRVLTEQGNTATPAAKPEPQDTPSIKEPSYPHQNALPSPSSVRQLFEKHCSAKGFCKPVHLFHLLTEALKGGVLAGSEKKLVLEHCKSLVVLTDSQDIAKLNWTEFQGLWDKIKRWTDIFLVFDKNKTQSLDYPEACLALEAAGIPLDDFVKQLVGLRYTEPDMTISYIGFLYLMMKLETMIYEFHLHDVVGKGAISVNYKQWLHMTMYN